jgi:hypothetical protein
VERTGDGLHWWAVRTHTRTNWRDQWNHAWHKVRQISYFAPIRCINPSGLLEMRTMFKFGIEILTKLQGRKFLKKLSYLSQTFQNSVTSNTNVWCRFYLILPVAYKLAFFTDRNAPKSMPVKKWSLLEPESCGQIEDFWLSVLKLKDTVVLVPEQSELDVLCSLSSIFPAIH